MADEDVAHALEILQIQLEDIIPPPPETPPYDTVIWYSRQCGTILDSVVEKLGYTVSNVQTNPKFRYELYHQHAVGRGYVRSPALLITIFTRCIYENSELNVLCLVVQTGPGNQCFHPPWWLDALRILYPNADDVPYVGFLTTAERANNN